MKHNTLLVIALLTSMMANAQFTFQNIALLGQFNDTTVVAEPVYGIRYQSCWGWVHPTTLHEYGVIGSTAGTYIIDVTDPANLIQSDYIPHRQTDAIWHEYKTFGNYLYIISDDGGNNSLQIADLSTLPDSANVIYDSNSIFTHSHTLFIDGSKLYVASVSSTGNFSSMNVYSLANPALPSLLRRLDDDFPAIGSVHDMFVSNDTVYASCGYDGLYIFHYDEILNQFVNLGSLTNFPTSRYNHSSDLSPNHQILYMCDEVPDGMPFSIVDVSDISNPTVLSTMSTNPGCTPHNPYVEGDLLYMAAYQDGLYVYDISVPSSPVQIGYFDTHPQNPTGTYPSPAYQGCWAAYTKLPSGNILASDMQLGLFVLDVSGLPTSVKNENLNTGISIYPSPAINELFVKIENPTGSQSITLTDITGKIVLTENAEMNNINKISVNEIAAGQYTVTIRDSKTSYSKSVQIK
ncbi:MAG: choice-of-anchor B family protein [Bacteroidetes bacterium]|nr:choice-of-anchor B family protein [Bacteroidota bacterium]